MINARGRLFASIRDCIEQHLRDTLSYSDVKVLDGIPTDEFTINANGRRVKSRHGKFKEIATVTFGDYVLTAESPAVDPPLGWIALTYMGEKVVEGPLDHEIWKLVAAFIRENGVRKVQDEQANGPAAVTSAGLGEWGSPFPVR